jgi:hypothetical protein
VAAWERGEGVPVGDWDASRQCRCIEEGQEDGEEGQVEERGRRVMECLMGCGLGLAPGSDYALGHSKVFMRGVASSALEFSLEEVQARAASKLPRFIKALASRSLRARTQQARGEVGRIIEARNLRRRWVEGWGAGMVLVGRAEMRKARAAWLRERSGAVTNGDVAGNAGPENMSKESGDCRVESGERERIERGGEGIGSGHVESPWSCSSGVGGLPVSDSIATGGDEDGGMEAAGVVTRLGGAGSGGEIEISTPRRSVRSAAAGLSKWGWGGGGGDEADAAYEGETVSELPSALAMWQSTPVASRQRPLEKHATATSPGTTNPREFGYSAVMTGTAVRTIDGFLLSPRCKSPKTLNPKP